jgi:hypothetical protein
VSTAPAFLRLNESERHEQPSNRSLACFFFPLHHPPTSSLKAMTDLLSQLRSLESKRVALDQTVRQTQARVRSSNAHDERMAKRHAEEQPASGAPAVASSVTIANPAPDARRLSSPREKQVNAHRSAAPTSAPHLPHCQYMQRTRRPHAFAGLF